MKRIIQINDMIDFETTFVKFSLQRNWQYSVVVFSS